MNVPAAERFEELQSEEDIKFSLDKYNRDNVRRRKWVDSFIVYFQEKARKHRDICVLLLALASFLFAIIMVEFLCQKCLQVSEVFSLIFFVLTFIFTIYDRRHREICVLLLALASFLFTMIVVDFLCQIFVQVTPVFTLICIALTFIFTIYTFCKIKQCAPSPMLAEWLMREMIDLEYSPSLFEKGDMMRRSYSEACLMEIMIDDEC